MNRNKNGQFIKGNKCGVGRPKNDVILPALKMIDSEIENNIKFLIGIRNDKKASMHYRIKACEIMIKKSLPDKIEMNEINPSTYEFIIDDSEKDI